MGWVNQGTGGALIKLDLLTDGCLIEGWADSGAGCCVCGEARDLQSWDSVRYLPFGSIQVTLNPIKMAPRHFSPAEEEEISIRVAQLQVKGVIKPCQSPWGPRL
eukprot:GHVN01030659.1.p2 GENE.GHVN01030659.1~~GHVN01030659.1.p2  ORF type:complete len:104 (+),score=5.56 GHVN01030659.1:932-1243(+)